MGRWMDSILEDLHVNEEDFEQRQREKWNKFVASIVEIATPIVTPLNVSILAVLLAVVYYRMQPAKATAIPKGPAPVVFSTFTPRTLLVNNGKDGKPVYLAVKGKVYDVTPGKNFYGPGGPYENFAGRDATRGLACQSFDEEMLTKNLDGPLDPCKDLTKDQLENLNNWVEKFEEKYLVVGKLISFTSIKGVF